MSAPDEEVLADLVFQIHGQGTDEGISILRDFLNKSGLPMKLRGDGPCSDCGTAENIVWFTESVFWNHVIRTQPSRWAEREPILCIPCFVKAADDMGYQPTGWRLLPEWPWRQHGAADGRQATIEEVRSAPTIDPGHSGETSEPSGTTRLKTIFGRIQSEEDFQRKRTR